jgi:RES domain-containing protein
MSDPISRLSGVVFRADHPDHNDLERTVEASRQEPGRFNTSEFGAVYVSREAETAISELRRNKEGLDHPCALFVVSLSASTITDLSDPAERDRWKLSLEDLTSDDMSRCRQIAESAVREGIEAIIWPSATGSGRSLAVFAERLREGSHLEILHSFELSRTVMASVDAGVPISKLHPVLSTFPSLDAQ